MILRLCLLLALTSSLEAQAVFAAIGPGGGVNLGATFSGFDSDYGKRILGGGTLYLDANLYRTLGVEVEARALMLRSDDGVRVVTYMAGPRVSTRARRMRAYGKLLAGRGEFTFPYHYAEGSYFAWAPGAGVDYRVGGSRLTLRLVDLEYQLWPGFSFGPLHPFGASTGLSFRVF